ncbi:major facilitator superfamily transporter [Colletotrichum scovillei]|uniref:Major facilitator superfamily transporter n=1 Tax=Colletotrichum scovillei TaxID=1209932 RepID=A0A9P7UBV3_9PEZI|nr:major facilitator superfamily transporter [Colletotrichum scovillei]KAG7041847.1 major facilitator superfamily transporter [Colletotrichum scovillei]KAG7061877.1 major facilitator superfamily transporter [Colletotrichum scovillei]
MSEIWAMQAGPTAGGEAKDDEEHDDCGIALAWDPEAKTEDCADEGNADHYVVPTDFVGDDAGNDATEDATRSFMMGKR